jgi:hypothetical protein
MQARISIVDMWSFWVDMNLCMFSFLSYSLVVGDQVNKSQGWNIINRFIPTLFLCLSQVMR